MSEAIFAEGLTKTYAGKTVVDHLDLSVKSGTVFGLLGANGAGKSTTIECMLGTKQADSGTVRLLGKDPKKKRRTLFQRVGVQFQEGDYPASFSAHWKSARIRPKPARSPSLVLGCSPPLKNRTPRLTGANTGCFCAWVLWGTTSRRMRMCAFTASVRFLRRRGPAGLRIL